MDIWCVACVEMHGRACSPLCLALCVGAVRPTRSPSLLWPLLTSRAAAASSHRRRPFRREARSPQVRDIGCPCTSAGFTEPSLIARASRSIARSPWSAPPRIRFLYVAPQVSLAASFGAVLTDGSVALALRFTRVGAIASPQDFHLLVNAHAGHTIRVCGAAANNSMAPLTASAFVMRRA